MFDSVLMVCTGSSCQSPMAEGLLRERLIADGKTMRIETAGYPTTDSRVHRLGRQGDFERGLDKMGQLLLGRQLRLDWPACVRQGAHRYVDVRNDS